MKEFERVFVSLLLVPGFVFLLASLSDSQEVEVWTNLGLYGGWIYDIAIDPSNPNKMFAGAYMGDGLFVTEDGGSRWQAVETGGFRGGEDEFKDHAVYAVKIAPSDTSVIWVAHNLWVERSMDGGQTWSHIYNRDMQIDCLNCGPSERGFRYCMSLAVAPSDPMTVYVGAAGPRNTYSSGAIFKTQDGGATWTKMNLAEDLDFAVVDIDIDPQDENTVWAVTSSWGYGGWGGTLYRSSNAGETWEEVFSLTLSGGAFLTVAVKPDDSNIVFTGSGYGIIKHFLEDGEWKIAYPVIPESAMVQDIAFDAQDPDAVFAVWRNPFYGDFRPRLARSINGGIDWYIYTIDYEFLTLAVHPTDPGVLLGGEVGLGVHKSEDDGQSWRPINEGINAVIVYDVAVDPDDSKHLIAGTISGVYERKGDEAWARLLTGDTRSVRFHGADSLVFYAGQHGYLAKTTDGGQTWTYSDWILDGWIPDIAVDPAEPERVCIAVQASGGGAIFRSDDGGASFYEVLAGENQSGEPYSFNVVAIDPANPRRILAGGGGYYAPKVLGDLWESMDGGDNWTRTGLQNVIVNALLIDPRDPNILYAGCGYSGGTDVPLFKSSDGGATWASSYEGIPELVDGLSAIWGISSVDVFTVGAWNGAATGASIFHCDGTSWSRMASETTQSLNGVWGSAPDDVFTVGKMGTALHYDGSSWTSMSTGTEEGLEGLWGASATEVFAAGDTGTILYYDGSGWSPMSSGTEADLTGVWGTSRTDVFAVGVGGRILHYDGESWSEMGSGTIEDLHGVWGSAPDEVFAVGDRGTILRFDGTSWTSMNSGTEEYLTSVWAASASDVFAVGGLSIVHYDGTGWAPMSSVPTDDLERGYDYFLGVWGASATDVFVGAFSGAILHYDGRDWTIMRAGGRNWNSVTDMEFHSDNPEIVYASTTAQGVYISPNAARNWLNLGTPRHDVRAISTGSLYAATEGGMLQCTGTGVISGSITDEATDEGIHGAMVFSDLGAKCRSIHGKYMMINPAGIGMLAAVADGYSNATLENVTVLGGDVTWVDISMVSGVPDPGLPPGHNDLTTDDGGGYCFIASAAYGSPLARQVQVLRQFRDTYLLPWGAGRTMVDLYYQYGKRLARMIETHQRVKPFVRLLLYPTIGMAWLSLSPIAAEKAAAGLILAAFVMAVPRLFGTGRCRRSGLGLKGLCLLVVATSSIWGLASSELVHASTIFKQVGIASSPNPVGSGARAMGMAGAFIAIADDATAASWNPGGLVQVEKPEISVVGAYLSRSEELTSGVLPGLKSDRTVDDASLNYLSVTYPFHLWTNWVVSLNYQRLYDFKRELDYTQDFRDAGLDLLQDKQYFQDGYLGALGIAGAVEILSRLSLGLTFNLWTDQLFWRNGWEERFEERAVATVADEGITIDTQIQDKYEEFRGFNFNVGLLWNPFDFLTIGTVVKTPFTASVRHEFRFSQVQTFDDPTVEPITTQQSILEDVDLKMPISYGIGIAGRISDALSVDLDIYRTHWSDYILEDSQGNKFSPIDGRPEGESDVQDTTMVRLGAEYLFIIEKKGLVVPVRGGFFYDPEPAYDSLKDFFGIAVGSGVAYKWIVVDLAYQLRWGTNVDTGNLIATTEGDILQHNFLFSLILHL